MCMIDFKIAFQNCLNNYKPKNVLMIAFAVETNMSGTKIPKSEKHSKREKVLFPSFTRIKYDPQGIKKQSSIDKELPTSFSTTSMLDTRQATPAAGQNTAMATANRCRIGGGISLSWEAINRSTDSGSSKFMTSTISSFSECSFHDRRMISRAGIVSIGKASVIVKARQSRPTNNSGSESSNDSKMLPVMCPSGVHAAYNEPEKPIAM